jgi:hypothetical protein
MTHCPPSAQSYTIRAEQPPSSHLNGPTNPCFHSSTAWPPRPSTTPPLAIFSSPDGTARARGSDDHDGASGLFDYHAGMATHPQRRNWTHVKDF